MIKTLRLTKTTTQRPLVKHLMGRVQCLQSVQCGLLNNGHRIDDSKIQYTKQKFALTKIKLTLTLKQQETSYVTY